MKNAKGYQKLCNMIENINPQTVWERKLDNDGLLTCYKVQQTGKIFLVYVCAPDWEVFNNWEQTSQETGSAFALAVLDALEKKIDDHPQHREH